jgi:hypothetical protein
LVVVVVGVVLVVVFVVVGSTVCMSGLVVVVVVVGMVVIFGTAIVVSSTFDVLVYVHVGLGYYCTVSPVGCIVVVASCVYFVGIVVARLASAVVVCLEWGAVSFLGAIQKTCRALP